MVNIDNLNALSKSSKLKLKSIHNVKSDIINIKIVKKYLLISLLSKLIFENANLFINIFFGRLNESIWFNEYFVKEYILRNLRPELVEKKDPPIITSIKYIKFKLLLLTFREIPIFDMLLATDKKLYIKFES